MTSSSRLIEGVHLMSHHLDPYATDLVHFPPWFLLLSRAVLSVTLPSAPQIGLLILYACADAAVVVSIGFIHNSLRASPLPLLTAIKICFNPLAVLSCLALSSASLYHALLFGSVAFAAAARVPMLPSLFLLAAATSMDFRAAAILPVLIATRSRVTASHANASTRGQVLRGIVYFSGCIMCYCVILAADVLILSSSDPVSTNVSFFARVQGGALTIWRAVHMFDLQVTELSRHTSHVTRHTSHVTRHTSHVTLQVRELVPTVGVAWYMMME
jgi:hypothetical protein